MFYEARRMITGQQWIASLDIIDHCNLKCDHCYYAFSEDSAKRQYDITLDDWKIRMRDIYESGIRKIIMLGGEPSLRPDVLMLAQEIFLETIIITNGIVKVPDEYEGSIIVSIDGLPETNDAIRGKSVFKRAIENYAGDPRCSLNITMMQNNYLELEGVVKTAIDNSFAYVTNNIYTGHPSDSLFVENSLRDKMVAEMQRVHKLYPSYYFMNDRILEWFAQPDHNDRCTWSTNAIHLDISGDKMKCFNEPDCSNCGCFAGAAFSCMDMKHVVRHPFKAFKTLKAYQALGE